MLRFFRSPPEDCGNALAAKRSTPAPTSRLAPVSAAAWCVIFITPLAVSCEPRGLSKAILERPDLHGGRILGWLFFYLPCLAQSREREENLLDDGSHQQRSCHRWPDAFCPAGGERVRRLAPTATAVAWHGAAGWVVEKGTVHPRSVQNGGAAPKAIPYRKFSGFNGCRSLGTNNPSWRISSSSNQMSPPPNSGRCTSTMSQCTAERLPLSHSW